MRYGKVAPVWEQATTLEEGGVDMAIASAVQRNNLVMVYDETGKFLFSKGFASGPNNGLCGYTADTLTIREQNLMKTYDAKGNFKFSKGV